MSVHKLSYSKGTEWDEEDVLAKVENICHDSVYRYENVSETLVNACEFIKI